MRMFVDTCVWRYWLSLKNGKNFSNLEHENHAIAFDKIFQIVSKNPKKHTFLYNARIEGELPDTFLKELPISFSKIKENEFIKKVPLPLSRADGTYKADGSILCGGKFGGTLRDILSMDGYDHKTALNSASPICGIENQAHTKPRKKEFDIEHLESALEAHAELFVTVDQPLINRLNHALQLFPKNVFIKMAQQICVRPLQVLERLGTS